jgi:phosphoribosylformylglycinamidine cyclo-ligase
MKPITKTYEDRGVSSTKDDVHKAISSLDTGLFKKPFCKIYPDYLTGSQDHCLISHADGAGTKSILAYLYWKETGDLTVWKNIAQDAIVMNTDDLLCVGATNNFCFTSTIGRNKKLITGDVLQTLILGTQDIFSEFKKLGININFMGGETADVGDVVKTIIVDGTMTTRIERSKVIDNCNIQTGDVIVGFSSFGQSIYESEYNSGIGSNGLTSARHDLLHKSYEWNYPESFDNSVREDLRFCGNYRLTDIEPTTGLTIGKLLTSPTRTYLPIVNDILTKINSRKIHGIIHCSGGGQTKVLNFVENLHIIKDNLFEIPPIYQLIYENGKNTLKEMYGVFNMGHRLEMYTDNQTATKIIEISKNWGVDAKIIGRVEDSKTKKLTIINSQNKFVY